MALLMLEIILFNKYFLTQKFTDFSTVPDILSELSKYLLNKWRQGQTAFKDIKESSVDRKFEKIKLFQKDDDYDR